MSTQTARARSRAEPAPAVTDEPSYSAVLVHGRLYALVGGDGVPDQTFEQGRPSRVDEQTAHRLAAAVDQVTRGHKTDEEGLYSSPCQKFHVTGPAGAVITPDGIEPPAAREIARLAAVTETA